MAFEQQPFGLTGLGARKQDSPGRAGCRGGSQCLRYPTPSPSSCPVNTSTAESSPGTGRAWRVANAAEKDVRGLMKGFGNKLSGK